MPKRSGKNRVGPEVVIAAPKETRGAPTPPGLPLWLPLVLAAVTFLAYLPSLGSDFVYDARKEILEEGFVSSLSNLPQVLSLKVLGTSLLLGPRPGQLLYLMGIYAVCGPHPSGFHLASLLLHAANVALLLVVAHAVAAGRRDGARRPVADRARGHGGRLALRAASDRG